MADLVQAAADEQQPVMVKSYMKYPRSVEELGASVQELMSNYDIEEILIRPGEPLIYIYKVEDGQDVRPINVTVYDLVRASPMEEIPDYPENVTPFGLVEILLHGLSMKGVWPLCLIVNDTSKFFADLGFSDDYIRNVQPPAFLGYPVAQDSRVAEDVVIAAATPTPRDGYGRINFSMFAHLD